MCFDEGFDGASLRSAAPTGAQLTSGGARAGFDDGARVPHPRGPLTRPAQTRELVVRVRHRVTNLAPASSEEIRTDGPVQAWPPAAKGFQPGLRVRERSRQECLERRDSDHAERALLHGLAPSRVLPRSRPAQPQSSRRAFGGTRPQGHRAPIDGEVNHVTPRWIPLSPLRPVHEGPRRVRPRTPPGPTGGAGVSTTGTSRASSHSPVTQHPVATVAASHGSASGGSRARRLGRRGPRPLGGAASNASEPLTRPCAPVR